MNPQMNLQEVLNNAVAAQREEELKNSPQLTLGEIICKLEALEPETSVVFDFANVVPISLDSWRGSYDELAIEYGPSSSALRVDAFLEMLREAIGKTFIGYKGGDFVMGRRTPVWVSHYGEGERRAVIDVKNDGYRIVIVTEILEYSP